MGISNLGFQITGAMVGWIVTGLIGLFVVSGLLWGLIRGLQKTAFRSLWLILTAVLLVLLTPVITKWITNIDLSGLNLEINGTQVSTVNEAIEEVISEIDGMEDAMQENPVLREFIKKLPPLLLNSLVFVILFFVLKIVLWPIWAIMAKIFFKKYKTVNGVKGKKMPKAERIKSPRYRGWGCLLGAFCGLFVAGVLMMPINGVLDTAETINTANTSFITAEPSEEGVVDYYLGDASEFITGANHNVGTGILKYTGMRYINKWTFDELSTMKIDNEMIVLKDETQGVVKVLNAIGEIRCYDLDNLTQESLAGVLKASRVVVNYFFELKTVNVIGDEVVPYIAKKVAETGVDTGATQTDAIVDDALLEVAKVNMEYLKKELNAIINVVEVANNSDVLLPMIRKDIPFNVYIERCDDEFVNDFVEALFSSQIFSAISATAINEGLDLAMEKLEVANFEKNTALTSDTVKAEFKNILSSLIAMSKHMDTDPMRMDVEALAPLGKMLDSIKTITTQQSFNAIVDKIDSEFAGALSEDYQETLSKAIANLKSIDSFETEFRKLEGVWNDIVELKDSDLSDFSTVDTSKIGKVLDSLTNSAIFGPVINDLVIDALESAQDNVVSSIGDEELRDAVNDAFTIMIWNINDNSLTRGEHFWEEEFTALGGMLDIDLSNDALNASNISNMGEIVDSMRDSVLMTRKVNETGNALNGQNAFNVLLTQVFDTATDKVLEGEVEGSKLSNIVTAIKNNLLNLPSDVTYASEFGYLADFMGEFENLNPAGLTPNTKEFGDTMTSLGTVFDKLAGSKVFVTETKDLRQDMLSYFVDEIKAKMTTSIIGSIDTTPITGETNSLISEMLNGVNNMPRPEALAEGETPYADEMGHLKNLINGLYSITDYEEMLNDSSDGSTLVKLGNTLDTLKSEESILCENAGYYIIKMFVNSITDLEDLTNTITNGTIKNNIVDAFENNGERVNATNYGTTFDGIKATYLNALKSFATIKNIFENVESNLSTVDVKTFDLTAFSNMLNQLQGELMADWNVTQYIAEFAMVKLEDSAIEKHNDAISSINAQSITDVQKKSLRATAKGKAAALINQIRKTKCTIMAEGQDIVAGTYWIEMTETIDNASTSAYGIEGTSYIYSYTATSNHTTNLTGGYEGLLQAIKTQASA